MTTGEWWRSGVQEPRRLAALEASGLLGTDPEDAFDRLTELAAVLTGAERACVSLVDAHHYVFKSAVGLADGASWSGPVDASFCRYVVGSRQPFVVEDASADPSICGDPAMKAGAVAAWAGYPVEDGHGWVLGTFCLIDSRPRTWSDTDLHVLATLAGAVTCEVALRRATSTVALAHQQAVDLRAGVAAIVSAPDLPCSAGHLTRLADDLIELLEQVETTAGPVSTREPSSSSP